MNRNTESHFSMTPTVSVGRSKFDRSFDHKTTFNTGDLIPIYYSEVLPGDSVKMRMSEVVRMQTPIAPVMDNAYLDTYFFFVPNRLVWEHFKQFMGENDTAPWTQTNTYTIPQIQAPAAGWKKGSLADYFGYPTNIGGYKGSALPFRIYVKVWNDWFRDQNLKNPLYMSEGDADITGTDKSTLGASYDPVVDTEKGAAPVKAAKFHDYFTSCLPSAQKGTAVNIPLGTTAPVVGIDDFTPLSPSYPKATNLVGKELQILRLNDDITTIVGAHNPTVDYMPSDGSIGLGVDLTHAVGATVNQLRQAFAIQKYYEKDALYGTRYIESVRAHFGVTNPDFRVQRSEYLGGARIPININQVIQTDASSSELVSEMKSYTYTDSAGATITVPYSDLSTVSKTPQGNAAAYSVTQDTNENLFNHSFTEHGAIIGLAVIRTDHGYQQGLNRQFIRKEKFDFYTPEFANLGNMAVYQKEIYCDGTSADDAAFGYQEAWADYRYHPNMVTGEMRSNYSLSLDIWHWADDYSSRPYLDSDWIDEPEENVARTLAVQGQDQFFGDFYFGTIWTRPMPLYSIPGLIDHH